MSMFNYIFGSMGMLLAGIFFIQILIDRECSLLQKFPFLLIEGGAFVFLGWLMIIVPK